MNTNIRFPEIQIADAMNCTAEDLKVRPECWFPTPDGCTVEIGSMALDCYFENDNLALILDARTGETVFSAAPSFDKVAGHGAAQYTFAPAANTQLALL